MGLYDDIYSKSAHILFVCRSQKFKLETFSPYARTTQSTCKINVRCYYSYWSYGSGIREGPVQFAFFVCELTFIWAYALIANVLYYNEKVFSGRICCDMLPMCCTIF